MTVTRRMFAAMFAAPAASSVISRLYGQNCAPPPGGTPVNFVPPTGLTLTHRKAMSTLTAGEVTRLRLAYKKLRDLTVSDPTDPRGWLQQANVHCWMCGGGPVEVHQSWRFLPWHRMYLFFHERILCKLLNDNSFRLPFWDWDATNSRNLPSIFRPATAGGQPNSLFDANRSNAASSGGPIPAPTFVPNPMAAASFTAFGGSANSGGGLENGPHGRIHVWTGNSAGVDMGSLDTAARDPVFYAHHCEIDHLWFEWNRRNPVGHANPTAPSFLATSFLFFDENKKWTKIKVSDVLKTTTLGYDYLPGAGLSKPAVPRFTDLTYDASSGLITVPEDEKSTFAPTGLVKKRELVVEDVVLPEKTGLYNVFVGDPAPADGNQAAAPNYVGYIGLIAGAHAHNGKSAIRLQVTDFLLQRILGPGAVLTYAESDSTQATKLTFSNVYISEE
ncbi:MAG: Polyphenol oxidase [Candidatus Solibacter sp.]|nr:Polyphenol oxidase [Candidatus Solibacter sp.]